jgi:hypothetical protein
LPFEISAWAGRPDCETYPLHQISDVSVAEGYFVMFVLFTGGYD